MAARVQRGQCANSRWLWVRVHALGQLGVPQSPDEVARPEPAPRFLAAALAVEAAAGDRESHMGAMSRPGVEGGFAHRPRQ